MPTRQGGTWWWVRYDPDLPVFKASPRPSPQWEVAKWEGGRWHFTGDEYAYDDSEIGEVGTQVVKPPELSTNRPRRMP